jgi:MoaA/NifB/PqqE/SkfB family radical SAM enzyme
MRIETLRAPLFVSWQLTRDCDLCCLHCCTESAPGKKLHDELESDEALRVARDIIANDVPYVMLCGGEPLVVPHFLRIAEVLGGAGIDLKIETNGQQLMPAIVERLAYLPIRSIQISLDGDTEDVYARQRPGGSLAKAHAACQAVRAAGLPLEITFAPTRHNIEQAGQVLERAKAFGAFRFNTGRLMRIGTAARLWDTLEPTGEQYATFRRTLDDRSRVERDIELCYSPFDVADGLRQTLAEPPATLLVLPNGHVKVAAALPYVCADLRKDPMSVAWERYREAWRNAGVLDEATRAIGDASRHARANRWQLLPAA